MKKGLRLIYILFALLLAAVILPGCGGEEEEQMPEEISIVAAKAATLSEMYADRLSGEWGDMHALLIESKEGGDFPGFSEMQAVLIELAKESSAARIYTMYPPGPKVIAPYLITFDGSLSPGVYGTLFEWEPAFTIAWEGETESLDHAWTNARGDIFISAYSPVYDSEGNITAILGVDYPAPEAALYPEWIEDDE